MTLGQIVSPTQFNRYIWLNAFTLLALLISGLADPFALVMAYFLETLIIGVLHAYKMSYVIRKGRTQQQIRTKQAFGKIIFFLFHYSFFVAVQSIFVFAIFQFADTNIKEPFNLIANYKYVLTLKGIGYGLLVLLFFLSIQTYISFFKTRMYDLYTIDRMFFQPYLRIFIQQFTVILALFFLVILPSGIMAALILILLRLFVDLIGTYIHASESNKKRLAKKLAEKTEESEEEIYDELTKLF